MNFSQQQKILEKTRKRLRTWDSYEERKIGKNKIEERNIFLSRDSCSCRAKRLHTRDSFEASKRLRTGDSFEASKRLRTGDLFKNKQEATYWGFVGKRKIEKLKIEERNIFLSCDSCSCRAKRLRIRDSCDFIEILSVKSGPNQWNCDVR